VVQPSTTLCSLKFSQDLNLPSLNSSPEMNHAARYQSSEQLNYSAWLLFESLSCSLLLYSSAERGSEGGSVQRLSSLGQPAVPAEAPVLCLCVRSHYVQGVSYMVQLQTAKRANKRSNIHLLNYGFKSFI